MRIPAAPVRMVLSLSAMLSVVSPTLAGPSDAPLRASPIPPDAETSEANACVPELAALALVEKMARAMGKDADVLNDAEEDLRSQAADCLQDGDDVTAISNRVSGLFSRGKRLAL